MSAIEAFLFFSASLGVFVIIFWQLYRTNRRLKAMNPNEKYQLLRIGVRSCKKCYQNQELFKSETHPALEIWMQSGKIHQAHCSCHADCAYYEDFKQIWNISIVDNP